MNQNSGRYKLITSIELKDLSISFPNQTPTIKNCNLQFIKGKTYLLTGTTASGKSTLLKFLKGIIPLFYPATISGELSINGNAISLEEYWNIREKIGYLFQDPSLQVIGSKVETDIAFGLENHAIPISEMRRSIERIAEKLGITDLLSRSPNTLSGGELALVTLASVLVLQPQIILLDEFTAYLDYTSRRRVFQLIKQIQGPNRIIIIVSHHLKEVLNLVDEVIVLEKGEITVHSPSQNFIAFNYASIENKLRVPEFYQIGTLLCEKRGIIPEFETIDELMSLVTRER